MTFEDAERFARLKRIRKDDAKRFASYYVSLGFPVSLWRAFQWWRHEGYPESI